MNKLTGGHRGDVGSEIAPETADDPVLAARIDDLHIEPAISHVR
jgi:hypothetical protein